MSILFVGAAAAFAAPLKGLETAQKLAARQRGELAGQTALVVGAADDISIANLSYNADLARAGSAFLREHGKWLFADRWARAIGHRHDFRNIPSCAGEAYAERPADSNFVRLSGFVPADAAERGRIVVVARANGMVMGYGRIPHHRSDLLGGLLGPDSYDWQGHARLNGLSSPELIAYLASPRAPVCRIGVVQPR